jgi:polar amino acid transport system substrate-binding protein
MFTFSKNSNLNIRRAAQYRHTRWLRSLLFCMAAAVLRPCLADVPLRIEINQAIQPFSLPQSNSGLLVEILRAAYASQGVPTTFVFLPAVRSWGAYSANEVDIVTDEKLQENPNAVFSQWPVLSFHTQVITLKQKNLKIESIKDLAPLRVVTFQNAQQVLGPDFAAMAAHNKEYRELPFISSRMLRADHADAIVSQPDIFRYNLLYEDKAAPQGGVDEYEYHDIFEKRDQVPFGFRSKTLRDQFERGLAAIYKDGEIDRIFASYQARFATSRDAFITLDCIFLTQKKPEQCAKMNLR